MKSKNKQTNKSLQLKLATLECKAYFALRFCSAFVNFLQSQCCVVLFARQASKACRSLPCLAAATVNAIVLLFAVIFAPVKAMQSSSAANSDCLFDKRGDKSTARLLASSAALRVRESAKLVTTKASFVAQRKCRCSWRLRIDVCANNC